MNRNNQLVGALVSSIQGILTVVLLCRDILMVMSTEVICPKGCLANLVFGGVLNHLLLLLLPPPPLAAPTSKSKPEAKPSREQVHLEIDAILRDAEQRRLKRSEQERQMNDAMLTTIFKAVHEDSIPESYLGDLFH